jgi:transcriptional regulator with XRE-family HTH domain
MINLKPEFCKAGRAILGWSQERLAEKAGISSSTVADFERQIRVPGDRIQRAIIGSFVSNAVIPELYRFATFLEEMQAVDRRREGGKNTTAPI